MPPAVHGAHVRGGQLSAQPLPLPSPPSTAPPATHIHTHAHTHAHAHTQVLVSSFDEKLPKDKFAGGGEYALETARHKVGGVGWLGGRGGGCPGPAEKSRHHQKAHPVTRMQWGGREAGGVGAGQSGAALREREGPRGRVRPPLRLCWWRVSGVATLVSERARFRGGGAAEVPSL